MRRLQTRVGRANSENKVLKYRVFSPDVTPLDGKDRTRVKYVMQSLVVVTVRASCRCTFSIRTRAAREGTQSIKKQRTKDFTPFRRE